MKLRLHSRGYFAGKFVIQDEHECFSIGDYIEVTLMANPFPIDEIEIGGRKRAIIRFPLRVEFSASPEETFADLDRIIGRTTQHWYECLEVGKTSVVVPIKYEYIDWIWYMPKIDGWKPGFGTCRRSTVGSLEYLEG